jgi:hypothetical protein
MAESPPFLAATLHKANLSLIRLGDVSTGLHDAEKPVIEFVVRGLGSTAPELITVLHSHLSVCLQ